MGELLTVVMSLNWDTLVQGLLMVVGGFALLATLTANKSDDKVVSWVLKAVNFLGANWGKSKNDPKEP